MSYVIGRGRTIRETYPENRASAGGAVTATPPLKAVANNVSATAFTVGASGLAHVTANAMDVPPMVGTSPGMVPVTDPAATDVVMDFIFGAWGLDVTHAASPYTPVVGQVVVPFDTSGGAISINMPANPVNNQIYGVKPTVASATPATVVAVGAGVTVEDPSTPSTFGATGEVAGQGSGAMWKFRLSDKKWIGLPGGF